MVPTNSWSSMIAMVQVALAAGLRHPAPNGLIFPKRSRGRVYDRRYA